jgi:hypothetical protein
VPRAAVRAAGIEPALAASRCYPGDHFPGEYLAFPLAKIRDFLIFKELPGRYIRVKLQAEKGLAMKIKGIAAPFSKATAAKVTLWGALLVMAVIVGLAVISGSHA